MVALTPLKSLKKTNTEIHLLTNILNTILMLIQLKPLKRILFTSSLLVCKNGYIPESDLDYCPPNLYGQSKVIGEEKIRQSDMSCEWVIVRPTSIWGPWFEHSYKTFFQMIDRGWYVHPGRAPIVKPLGYVGNTAHKMLTLLFDETEKIYKQTFYLGDYPQHSLQDWANMVHVQLGKSGKIPIFPIKIMGLVALFGDALKHLGYNDPPLTSFRLSNMLTGAHYPIEKTEKIVGELPYILEEGVRQTLRWMDQECLLLNKPLRGAKELVNS